MRNRNKQRDLKSAERKEERLNSKTEWGISDPVPKQCVDNLIDAELQNRKRKVGEVVIRLIERRTV